MASNHRNQEIPNPYRRDPQERRDTTPTPLPPVYRKIHADIRIGRPYTE